MRPPLREDLSPLVAIVGPTGSGKSSVALDAACAFDGEILSCDSLQVFRHFNIGTAKLGREERREIPHYLIDICDPDEVFTAGDYSRLAREIVREVTGRKRLPVVVGGTGFYLRSLVDGLAPGPRRDEELRARLTGREAARPGGLHRLLRRLDSRTAERIHPNDIPKVVRALEICLRARKPAQEVFREGRDPLEGFRILKIGLFPKRDLLYQRIDSRVDQMFTSGLVEEVRSILDLGVAPTAKPFESIGYKQALQFLSGDLSLKDAVFYTKRDSRRYAKRQMTWFRQEPGIQVIHGFGDDEQTRKQVMATIADFLRC